MEVRVPFIGVYERRLRLRREVITGNGDCSNLLCYESVTRVCWK